MTTNETDVNVNADENLGVQTQGDVVQPQDSHEKSDKEINLGNMRKIIESQKQALTEAQELIERQNQILSQHKTVDKPVEDSLDEFDELEDYETPTKAQLIRREQKLLKKFEELAKKQAQEFDRSQYLQKLQNKYSDYNEVMTAENLKWVEQNDPDFAELASHVSDNFLKAEKVYRYIKKHKEKPNIQKKVEENQNNPYLAPTGTFGIGADQFDASSPQSREAAYQRLKSWQSQPIEFRQPRR